MVLFLNPPMTSNTMERRLSFQELKAQTGRVITNLEAIKGGNLNNCHSSKSKVKIEPSMKFKPGKKGYIEIGIKIKF